MLIPLCTPLVILRYLFFLLVFAMSNTKVPVISTLNTIAPYSKILHVTIFAKYYTLLTSSWSKKSSFSKSFQHKIILTPYFITPYTLSIFLGFHNLFFFPLCNFENDSSDYFTMKHNLFLNQIIYVWQILIWIDFY